MFKPLDLSRWQLPEGVYPTVARCASTTTASAFKTISEIHFKQESSEATRFSTQLTQKYRLAGIFVTYNTTYMAVV